jgi:hypothetical protein
MSETVKKKPDFNKLDFSKMTNGEITPTEVPAPVAGIEAPVPEKKTLKEGVWLFGKDIKDVTPEEFRDWLSNILPGVGVEKWEDKTIATPKDREKVILRLSLTFSRVFNFPRTLPAEKKEYVN